MESIDKMRRYFNGRAKGLPYDIKAAVIAVTVDDVFAMLDEIEREVAALADERDLLKRQWEAGVDFDQRLESCADNREDVTLFGVDYTALPVDADGVPIHVEDVMEWPYGNGEFRVNGIGGNTLFYIDKDSGECEWTAAWDKHHHHAPTVEDVLREMLEAWGELPSNVTNEAIIAKYAAKLQLKED